MGSTGCRTATSGGRGGHSCCWGAVLDKDCLHLTGRRTDVDLSRRWLSRLDLKVLGGLLGDGGEGGRCRLHHPQGLLGDLHHLLLLGLGRHHLDLLDHSWLAPARALNDEQVVSGLDDVVCRGLDQHRLHLLSHGHRGLGGGKALLPGFLISLGQWGGVAVCEELSGGRGVAGVHKVVDRQSKGHIATSTCQLHHIGPTLHWGGGRTRLLDRSWLDGDRLVTGR